MPKTLVSEEIDTGIQPRDREAVAKELSQVLADTYMLYLKTHNFHWNVTGHMFYTLHNMFEQQYNELWLAVDLLAERIRALGAPAPGSSGQFARLSSIPEETGIPMAEDMVRRLLEGHETVVRTARHAFARAESAGDQATVDLLIDRLRIHEKMAWMLRSLIQ